MPPAKQEVQRGQGSTLLLRQSPPQGEAPPENLKEMSAATRKTCQSAKRGRFHEIGVEGTLGSIVRSLRQSGHELFQCNIFVCNRLRQKKRVRGQFSHLAVNFQRLVFIGR